MLDSEALTVLGNRRSTWDKARQVFYAECARLEQAGMQSDPPSPLERRKMEFEAVRKIAEVLGVDVTKTEEKPND